MSKLPVIRAGLLALVVASLSCKPTGEGDSLAGKAPATAGLGTVQLPVNVIFTAKKYALDAVAHIPQDLRDKALLSFKEDQLDQVTVAQGADVVVVKNVNKTWKADKLVDADDAKVKALAESFDNLSGSGYVAPGSPELASLVKPRATITLKPKTGAPVVLNVGDVRGEDVVVQKVGQDAMWLKKFQLDRFLKKPAELAKDKK